MASAYKDQNGNFVGTDIKVNSNVSALSFTLTFSPQGEMLDCVGFDANGNQKPVSDKARKILAVDFGYVCALARKAT